MPENSLPPFHPSRFSVCSNLQMVAMLAYWVMVMGRDRVEWKRPERIEIGNV